MHKLDTNFHLLVKFIIVIAFTIGAILILHSNKGINLRTSTIKPIDDLKNTYFESKTDGSGAVNKQDTSVLENDKPIKFSLIAGGDVMLSRAVGTKINQSGNNSLPFINIKDYLLDADISFINLEAPFLDSGPMVTEGMIFKTEPEYIAGLIHSDIDIVSLANNHTLNKGRSGLEYTQNFLTRNGIQYIGSGNNNELAHTPVYYQKGDHKYAFLAYTYSDGNYFSKHKTDDVPDIAFMDIKKLKEDIQKISPHNVTIIVSMHAGHEYTKFPNQLQKDFAHAAIDAGASLVLGHHPHVVQHVEEYNSGYIIYSLGNLIFDQMWSRETTEGLLAKIEFKDGILDKINFSPVVIENYSTPRFASETETTSILKRMNLDSTEVNFNFGCGCNEN